MKKTLPQGAVGVVSGGSHVVGDLMKQMISSYQEDRVGLACELGSKAVLTAFGRSKRQQEWMLWLCANVMVRWVYSYL